MAADKQTVLEKVHALLENRLEKAKLDVLTISAMRVMLLRRIFLAMSAHAFLIHTARNVGI